MPYSDLNLTHNPATGTVAPATWGDQIRTNQEFFIDPPACSVFHSATVNATSGTPGPLLADSENFDNDAMHSTVTNNSRITAVTAGRYLVTGIAEFSSNSLGYRQMNLRKNGTTSIAGIRQQPLTDAVGNSYSISQTVVLAATDYLELMVLQTSGSTLTVQLYEFAVLYLTR